MGLAMVGTPTSGNGECRSGSGAVQPSGRDPRLARTLNYAASVLESTAGCEK